MENIGALFFLIAMVALILGAVRLGWDLKGRSLENDENIFGS